MEKRYSLNGKTNNEPKWLKKTTKMYISNRNYLNLPYKQQCVEYQQKNIQKNYLESKAWGFLSKLCEPGMSLYW